MTAETILSENTRYDRSGNPVEVTIPYAQFVEFLEQYGIDLSQSEREEIFKAQQDREDESDAFTSLESFKASL